MTNLDFGALWRRLKDDFVFRVGTLYAGACWFFVEALDTLQLSASLIRGTAVVLALLFLPVIGAAMLWRRSRARHAEDASPAPRRRATLRWAAATASLLVLALGLWAFGPRVAGGVVPVAAERIAVLPFHGTGSAEVREFGIGLVDLLAAALSDVGPIRTVSSRSVLAHVGQDAGALPPERARTLARQLGAGSVLTGSITAFGDEVRIIAELRDAASGATMATAEVRGARTEVMHLTDRLATSLIRELWRSRAPLPTINVAGLTTDVPSALRAWLTGEQHLRAFRVDSAIHHFTAAVEADSTFALAWFRLAEATGWEYTGGIAAADGRLRRAYFERAMAHAGRLPPRERSLLHGYNLHEQGNKAAFDSLQRYVREYPDDPMGWYYLGDARFHAAFLGRFSDAEIMQPFFEALRLDPSFGPGLLHLLDMSFMRLDRALFDSVMPLVRRSGVTVTTDRYERHGRLFWAPADSLLPVFVRELRALDPVRQRSQVSALIVDIARRVRLDPMVDPWTHIAAMDSLVAVLPPEREFSRWAHSWAAVTLLSMGRMTDGFGVLDRQIALEDLPPGLTRPVRTAVARLDLADRSYLPMAQLSAEAAVLEALPDTSGHRGLLGIYYTLTGRKKEAEAHSQQTPNAEIPGLDGQLLAEMNQAWANVMDGDTAANVPRLVSAVGQLNYSALHRTQMMWDDLGRLLSRTPGHEAEGVRMMQVHLRGRGTGAGVIYLEIARALEAQGDRAGAREAWQQAWRYLQHAEPVQQHLAREAHAALARLAAEPTDPRR